MKKIILILMLAIVFMSACASKEDEDTTKARKLIEYHKAKFDWTDGIKINFSDSWIHIRPSNTEPVIRIFSEAKQQKTAQKLCSDVVSYINQLVKK